MDKITTAECIKVLKNLGEANCFSSSFPHPHIAAAIAQLLALQKMESKHGACDADEVEHYESCECCQNFHRMEQRHDKIKKAAQEMAKSSKDLIGFMSDANEWKDYWKWIEAVNAAILASELNDIKVVK